MSIRQFIRNHRAEISNAVAAAYGENVRPSNDEERRQWVLNDEGLYNWARSEGVRI